MTFSEFLLTKRIDETKFRQSEPECFREWQYLFEQVHAESFTMQKKFLINSTRRKYLLTTP